MSVSEKFQVFTNIYALMMPLHLDSLFINWDEI